MNDQHTYWFPAKKYGWGWGIPSTWQGWAVLLIYFMLILLGTVIFDLKKNAHGYLLFAGVLSVLLVIVCWRTGEPTRWRWGK